MVAVNKTFLGVCAAGLCVGVAVAGIGPSMGRQPKAVSWDHQGLSGIRGIDVSRWQHVDGRHPDFAKLQRQGVRFVVIKSGDSYSSAHSEAGYWYARDKAAVKRAGMLVGAYYYAVPTSNSGRVVRDARAQARKASARVGGQLPKGHLPLALDLETDATSLNRSDLTRWAIAWLRVVERRTGRTPWFYTYTDYLNRRLLPDPALTKYPLWHANWGLYLDQEPLQPRGWPTSPWRVWQFTDSGRLAGSGSKVLDLNVYRGTAEELLAEAGLAPKAAQKYDLPRGEDGTIEPSAAPSGSASPTPVASPTGQ